MASVEEHLVELEAEGVTVVPDVIDEDSIAALKEKVAAYRREQYPDDAPFDGELRFHSALRFSGEVARAVTHPLALSVLRQYLGTDDIHFGHQPAIIVLKPAKETRGTFPPSGWHSDYPYHPGVFPDEAWPASPPLGAQFNICLDPFTAETGATQYVPGSHREGRWPPAALNESGTRMGEGVHSAVRQLTAPAGSALIYDARTWHRACPELNVSGRDRLAILNAVSPAWVRPMMDKSWLTAEFSDVPYLDALDERERRELDRLCHRDTQPTPEGMPRLQERQSARRRAGGS